MNKIREWLVQNDYYLSTAIKWLRLRLQQSEHENSPQVLEPIANTLKADWPGNRNQAEEIPVFSPEDKNQDNEITQAEQTMADAAAITPAPALVILSQRFGLSRFEQNILLLCIAMELDTRISGLCARFQGQFDHPYPTFALALTLFDNASWDALSPERPLRYWKLIEINQTAATPLTLSALRADERIVNYCKGLNQLDERLMPLLVPFEITNEEERNTTASQEVLAGSIVLNVKQCIENCQVPIIQLTGIDPVSKQQVARLVLSELRLQGFRMPAELLPTTAGDLEILSRLWQRESTLLPLALYLDTVEMEDGNVHPDNRLSLKRFLSRCRTVTFLDTREPYSDLGYKALAFEVEKPSPTEQYDAWTEELGESASGIPTLFASHFNLNLPTIRQIARNTLSDQDQVDPASLTRQLWNACVIRTRPRLDRLAERIDTKAEWDDLVLPADALKLLHEISAQVCQRTKVYDEWGFRRKMNRGFGISALFTGESGTGKTMAAEVIANELNLNLYRIDLSAVVSKYIGETEKNMRRVFDAAEDGGVILFFDEADALFGKRSEVKDSHDRYANIEINYLLQRMEAFGGLAILATNMKTSLDQAFVRRLRFIVNFPFPGLIERKRIWAGAFPNGDYNDSRSSMPLDILDYDHLARLNLTGGSIHNVALNAAFLAAQRDSSVDMVLICEAARTELKKMEKPLNEADFRIVKPTGAKV
jgi:hypothetical protein